MPRARLGTLASAICGWLLVGCPSQDLAPLNPCTVAAASIRVDQGGLSKVDLLFVVDNSASMASEQEKVANQLPRLVNVLTSGDRYADREDEVPAGLDDKMRFFTAVKSLHLGVVSSSMAGLPAGSTKDKQLLDCTAGQADDGRLLNSTQVAIDGVTQSGKVVLAPQPKCKGIDAPQYQAYEAGGDVSPEELATAFGCVSRLGIDGCPYEQQLEAMWKAVAPSDGKDPDLHVFYGDTEGNGDPGGFNAGFVREDAILAVIEVSDEEDCSVTQEGSLLFANTPEANERFGEYGKSQNLRCGQFAGDNSLLWDPERYVRGLKSLKPGHEDRVIFAAIVGIPIDAYGQDLDEVLARDELKFEEVVNGMGVATGLPRTSCQSAAGDDAYPPRRFLEVAKGFGEDAVVYSICADDYGDALNTLIERIASKLTGNCLPRQLVPNEEGKVRCDVFELLPDGVDKCDPSHGHDQKKTVSREVVSDGKRKKVRACHMNQVAVHKGVPDDGDGWFYDDFAKTLVDECADGSRQRISFSFGELPTGGGAVIECFQTVARIDADAKGVDAVNTRCGDGEEACSSRNSDEYELFCGDDNTCQISCKFNTQCPAGWVCGGKDGADKGTKYCQQPTCPSSDSMNAE